MVKLPKDFIAAGYEFDVAIPSAKFETARTPEGSVVFRVGYETNAIEEFTQQVAHEMNKKVEAAIMDELLRLNGYAPERTCRMEYNERKRGVYCSCCGKRMSSFVCNDYGDEKEYTYPFCCMCGARVVDDAD